MDKKQLIGALEAILFVSGEPISFARLEKTFDITTTELAELVVALREKLNRDETTGLRVIIHDTSISLATKGIYAEYIEQLTKATLQETPSRASLEVLAIIAYQAPISRSEIEMIRGVNCNFTLRNLLLRGLIERKGNADDHRGYLYQPTVRFLQSLDVSSIDELPDFSVLRNDVRLSRILETTGEVSQQSKQTTPVTDVSNT